MPTYQYACTACDHAFEQVQSFSDDALSVCPACEGRLRKVFNAVGVVFKGSGFYRNDSRKTSDPGDSGSSAAKSGDSGSSSGSESSSGSSTSESSSSSGEKKSSGSTGSSSSSTTSTSTAASD